MWSWTLLAAGNVGPMNALCRKTRRLMGKEQSAWSSGEDVADAVRDAIQTIRDKDAELRVLRPHGYTKEQLFRKGKRELDEVSYQTLQGEFRKARLGVAVLVLGFDVDGEPRIFAVDETGSPKDFTNIGFWAIGSGGSPALSTLLFHNETSGMGFHDLLHRCIYHVLEAKFMADSSVGTVGKATILGVYAKGKNRLHLLPQAIRSIRKLWLKRGAPRFPNGVVPLTEHLSQYLVLDDTLRLESDLSPELKRHFGDEG